MVHIVWSEHGPRSNQQLSPEPRASVPASEVARNAIWNRYTDKDRVAAPLLTLQIRLQYLTAH